MPPRSSARRRAGSAASRTRTARRRCPATAEASGTARSTPADFPCPPAARRSGGSPRSTACATCTRTTAAGDGSVSVEVDAAPEVDGRDGRPRRRRGSAQAGMPADRVARAACVVVREGHRRHGARARPVARRADGRHAARRRAAGRAFGHLLVERRAVRRGGRRARPRRQRDLRRQRRGRRRRRRQADRRRQSQDWDDDAVHVAQHVGHGRPRRHASSSIVVTLGGDLVRLAPEASATPAPGGDAELLGLYFADAGQHLEHRLFVDHAVPHCRSRRRPTRARCRARTRTRSGSATC